jgi:hypothetical protein
LKSANNGYNEVVMNLHHSKSRWLVVPLLVLSLSAVGIANCPGLGAGWAPRVKSKHAAPVCCCCKGRCEGRCGMACCQKPAPDQDRLPVEPKSQDDSVPSLAIGSVLPAAIDFASGGLPRRQQSAELAATTACPTLLALNVRFNV